MATEWNILLCLCGTIARDARTTKASGVIHLMHGVARPPRWANEAGLRSTPRSEEFRIGDLTL